MTEQPPICVLGDANVDVIMPVDEYPPPGSDKRSEQLITGLGGSAANAAVVLARFGWQVVMIARVGDDNWGDFVRSMLQQGGVGVECVRRIAGEQTGMMFVPVTPDGQRTLFGRRGANRMVVRAELPQDKLSQAAALHLSGYAFLEEGARPAINRAIDLVRDGGGLVCLDTAYEPAFVASDAICGALPRVDLVILGIEEAEAITGHQGPEAVSWFLDQGVEVVALKLGARGSCIYEKGGTHEIPAISLRVVDTTGAGDAFSAGLLHGILAGLSVPAAGIVATACGAVATTVWGAGCAFPSVDAVRDALRASKDSVQKDLQQALDEALVLLDHTGR